MSELEQLKQRIIDAGEEGLETSIVHDDYEPAGQLMINQLTHNFEREFVTCRTYDNNTGLLTGPWRVWHKNSLPDWFPITV